MKLETAVLLAGAAAIAFLYWRRQTLIAAAPAHEAAILAGYGSANASPAIQSLAAAQLRAQPAAIAQYHATY